MTETFTEACFSILVNAFVNKKRSPLGMRGDPGFYAMLFSVCPQPATLPVQTPSLLKAQYSPSTSMVVLETIPPVDVFR